MSRTSVGVVAESMVGIIMLGYAIGVGIVFVFHAVPVEVVFAVVLMDIVLALTVDDSLLSGLAVGVLTYISVLSLLGGIRFKKGQLPVLSV